MEDQEWICLKRREFFFLVCFVFAFNIDFWFFVVSILR